MTNREIIILSITIFLASYIIISRKTRNENIMKWLSRSRNKPFIEMDDKDLQAYNGKIIVNIVTSGENRNIDLEELGDITVHYDRYRQQKEGERRNNIEKKKDNTKRKKIEINLDEIVTIKRQEDL